MAVALLGFEALGERGERHLMREQRGASEQRRSDAAVELPLSLAEAVVSCLALRDLLRLRVHYPNAVSAEDADALREALGSHLRAALADALFDDLRTRSSELDIDAPGTDEDLTLLIVALLLRVPGAIAPVSNDDVSPDAMRQAFATCRDRVGPPLKDLVNQLVEIKLYDCRMPEGDPSFSDPRRSLQLLRAYWYVCRSVVLHLIDACVGCSPHPLTRIIVSCRARIDGHFARLEDDEASREAKEAIDALLETVLGGEPDDLSAVPEWTRQQLQTIEGFLENARLRVGSKVFPLTHEEEMFIAHAESEVLRYHRDLDEAWTRMLATSKARATPHPDVVTTPTATAPARSGAPGGAMTAGSSEGRDDVTSSGATTPGHTRARTRDGLASIDEEGATSTTQKTGQIPLPPPPARNSDNPRPPAPFEAGSVAGNSLSDLPLVHLTAEETRKLNDASAVMARVQRSIWAIQHGRTKQGLREAARTLQECGAYPWPAHSLVEMLHVLRLVRGPYQGAASYLVDCIEKQETPDDHVLHEFMPKRSATATVAQRPDVEFAAGYAKDACIFQKQGKGWLLVYDGTTRTMPHSKGMAYLSHLLRDPDRVIPAATLRNVVGGAANPPTLGSVGEDPEARSAYRELREIDADLDEARANNDEASVGRLEQDRERVVTRLAQIADLDGRPARESVDEKRARQSVSKAIQQSIEAILQEHRPLGLHLQRSIDTGAGCVYRPDRPVAWTL